MSYTVSPREKAPSGPDMTTGCMPSRTLAISNETRVRIDGFWKMSAMDLPSSGLLLTPRDQARFCASAASRIMSNSVGVRSASESRSRPLSDVSMSDDPLGKNVG